MWAPYSLYLPAFFAGAALSSPLAAPEASLDQATFTGISDGTVNQFLGIPFAKPPVGPLRFNAPVPVDPYEGSHAAVEFGPFCPQQFLNTTLPPGLPNATLEFLQVLGSFGEQPENPPPESEDCLSLNVIAPATATPASKLPVVVWIYGGGFETGVTFIYPGAKFVKRAIELEEPVIYVSMNYRVAAFGFLASKEVKQAGLGNFGMQDQRLALRWVQKYISAFGGDPSRVTIWGESAGAMSVGLHMVTNNGNAEGLFHGAIMQSGGPFPTGDIENGQSDYDALVQKTGCTGSADTLACLRQADYAVLKQAIDESPSIAGPQALRLAWVPRVDGKFLTATPMELVRQGSVAKVPFITGNCDDEGTSFSFATLNVTTDDDFRGYIASNYLPTVPDAFIGQVLQRYPSDPAQGSPFDTGAANAFTPQFKRISAFEGDWIFQAPRRFFLKHRATKQKAWSFLSKRFKSVPIHGSTHSTDMLSTFNDGNLGDYLIHFIHHLDPNGKTSNTSVVWPQYMPLLPRQLTLLDDAEEPVGLTGDGYRSEAFELLDELALKFPF